MSEAHGSLSPAEEFGTPEKLLASESLSREQKLERLLRWEQDARLLMEAESEGMEADFEGMEADRPESMLQRVRLAIDELRESSDSSR